MNEHTAEQIEQSEIVINRCKERLAHAINLLEKVVDEGNHTCDVMGWDNGVFYEIEELSLKLSYRLADLIRWDKDTID